METEKLIQAINLAMDGDDEAVKSIVLPIIRVENELDVFEAPFLRYPSGSGSRVSSLSLAHWLVDRAREVGSENAVGEMRKFLTAQDVPMLQITPLAGIKLSSPVTLDEEMALVPFDQIPQSSSRTFFLSKYVKQMPYREPSAALVRFSFVPKAHYFQQGATPPPIARDLDTPERMQRTSLLLALILRSPVENVASWSQTASWIPLTNAGAHLLGTAQARLIVEKTLTARAGGYLRILYSAYWGMKKDDRTSLAISLDRLNRAMSSWNFVDSAIDLGICLESFFMADRESSNQEISFTLKVRAARLLATSFTRRTEIAALVQDLYKLRSEAVHKGRFATSTAKKMLPETRLREGQKLIARALRNTIRNGRLPDWQGVIFRS